MGFYKMIRAEEVAVCFSGLARAEHEWVIERTKKILPYDTFFSTWEGYTVPRNISDCKLFPEPKYDYHNLIETKTKPDCMLWKKYTTPPPPHRTSGEKMWGPKKN